MVSALSSSPSPAIAPEALERERSHLFHLCYRMTGSASDAEDLVQETFIRALEHPPPDVAAPLRPWLVRVAVNLARDHLRRRKRRGYVGTWLPSPVETPPETAAENDAERPGLSPEVRYGLMESASFAFLLALEALTPSQRAVLLLRDAFDYSSRETAEALGLSEENVRTTLHRARKIMETYDETRTPLPGPAEREAVVTAFQRLLAYLSAHDIEGALSLFAPDARLLGDGGGVQPTARAPVHGAARIVKIYSKIITKSSPEIAAEIRNVNGVPAIVGEDPKAARPAAPRFVMLIDLDAAGLIRTMYTVLAPEKLSAIAFPLSGRQERAVHPS
jgi:RNA polymerase sigma-70 factor (ECF subfamily)